MCAPCCAPTTLHSASNSCPHAHVVSTRAVVSAAILSRLQPAVATVLDEPESEAAWSLHRARAHE
eukprot:CAMPEP_0115828536 /NCGR_PEP_ID=MMETSP0287-20121206/623_1 /TAXON_ID=412157 /ORGANISM="Chrysochromulina rotalis, Strain UIO044" /LENGTH=64 /DNA_ID=CAMNT_0003281753 /DNA_START=59 /DNA_END=253 /DNA_ORIENTATION=+